MTSMIRIAAVDDHSIFLSGLRRSLRHSIDITIIAEGCNGDDACRIARDHRPDIMLLDISMEGGGIKAAGDIIAENPAAKVVILTASMNDDDATAALSAGARGYLLKGISSDELTTALRDVYNGKPYITPSISARLLIRKLDVPERRADPEAFESRHRLTDREKQILELTCLGMTNNEIARNLNLTVAAVKNYTSHIFSKLNVRSRAEAVARYLSRSSGT